MIKIWQNDEITRVWDFNSNRGSSHHLILIVKVYYFLSLPLKAAVFIRIRLHLCPIQYSSSFRHSHWAIVYSLLLPFLVLLILMSPFRRSITLSLSLCLASVPLPLLQTPSLSPIWPEGRACWSNQAARVDEFEEGRKWQRNKNRAVPLGDWRDWMRKARDSKGSRGQALGSYPWW